MAQVQKLTKQFGVINMNGNKITSLATPTASTDAVTKAYADAVTSTGTVTSGTWHGSTITVPYGGTGVATLTANAVLIGNGVSAVTGTSALTFASNTLTLSSGNGLTVGGNTSLGFPLQLTNYSYQAQVNSSTITILAASGYHGLILTGASVANQTVVMPAGVDGQIFTVTSVGGVSGTFSMTATGASFAVSVPSTLTAGQVLRYVYRLSNTTWYPI